MDKHLSEIAALHKEQQEKAAKDAEFLKRVLTLFDQNIKEQRMWVYGYTGPVPHPLKGLW